MKVSSHLAVPKSMRAISWHLCLLGLGLSPVLFSIAGCAKEVKAEFPRPPATATLPPPEEPSPAPAPAPAPAEPEPEPVEEPAEENTEEPRDPPRPSPPRRTSVPPPDPEEPPPEPPSTTLSGDGDVDPELAAKLERASTLLQSVSRRHLTSVQADQLVAARGFVAQARQALSEGDPRRALVLIDKGLILAEDVDRVSRP
jgi:hypothetical protein